jgi:GNAT superfamily N-acetyltransferase
MNVTTSQPYHVRSLRREDHARWLVLWQGYNAFYGRTGTDALPDEISDTTFERFFDDREPVHALVADGGNDLVGIAHFLYHRSTTALRPVCYLQDLFTDPAARGQGVASALVHHVYDRARSAAAAKVYWQTHRSNEVARSLYAKLAQETGFLVYARAL